MTLTTEIDARPAPEPENQEAANVDKIREILFGGQMRNYERQFVRLEEQLAKETESLRTEARKRYETLETYVHGEIDSLKQRLKTEKIDRTASVQGLQRDVRESTEAATKRFAELEETLSEATGDVRARLLEQSKTLAEDIDEKHRALSALVEREVQKLHHNKTDRETLADLLVEVAMRLRDEFAIPEGGTQTARSA